MTLRASTTLHEWECAVRGLTRVRALPGHCYNLAQIESCKFLVDPTPKFDFALIFKSA